MNLFERVAARAGEQPTLPVSSDRFDLPGFIAHHEQLQVRKEKPLPDGGTLYELETCPFNAAHRKGSAFITQGINGRLGFKCHHNSCLGKGWKELRAFLEPDYYPGEFRGGHTRINGDNHVNGELPNGAEGAEHPPHSCGAEGVDGWPKPEPMQDELPPVAVFSEELLPDSFRPLVADVAERMQVPMDYPAVVVVLALAGAVNRRAVIQPKANDTRWVVTPNLWGGLIAPPGFMKSPVIQAATRPLNLIQAEWLYEHEQVLKSYAREKEEYELRRTAWKEQYKANTKRGQAVPDRPKDEPEKPTLGRLIVNDATFEALHQAMSENPAGMLVIRDELPGWWSQLDRAGREGERAFCLEAWNGDSAFTVDRIGRGTIHVPHCCMSMLGGIQPGRLRSYLADALKDGPTNDGLIQRFQVLVWPDTPSNWSYVDRPPHASSEEWAAQVFRTLVEMDAENPARFRFVSEAQDVFVEWLATLEAKIRGHELHPALISHLSKYRKLMPALALLFELADRAGRGL